MAGGREISDMYLKHPGNESSSDDEGTETQVPEQGKFMCLYVGPEACKTS